MKNPDERAPFGRLAVLVDGDNVPPKALQAMLAEVATYGTVIMRRVYGDWTSPNMQGWKEVLHTYAFTPVQQFRYVSGKNSTDAALIIDAMDILYRGDLDGFALISSDSDYTRLATRIRESGKYVLGMGEKKTPLALVSACDKFVYIENLVGASKGGDGGRRPKKQAAPAAQTKPQTQAERTAAADRADLHDLLIRAYEAVQGEDGFAQLSHVGNQLSVLQPGFDPRSYGKRQLRLLVEDTGLFEVRREPPKGPNPHLYIRLKE